MRAAAASPLSIYVATLNAHRSPCMRVALQAALRHCVRKDDVGTLAESLASLGGIQEGHAGSRRTCRHVVALLAAHRWYGAARPLQRSPRTMAAKVASRRMEPHSARTGRSHRSRPAACHMAV